ncbi:hypothetical protein BHM03_00008078 [Ensete ventricosum]|nr:hypothetical protein BHM03_00008078 [Ensete ventricosum]
MNPLLHLAEISGAFTKSSRLHSIKLPDPPMMNWPKEPPVDARPNYYPHPQKTKAKRIAQDMTETQIIWSCIFPAMTLHPYIFVSRDKLFPKCYVPPNPLWFLMWHSQILGDFHDFPQEQTMMLEVFPDDDL